MKKVFLLASITMLIASCNQENSKKGTENYEDQRIETMALNSNIIVTSEPEGYVLMRENCYVCHNPNTKSHDDLLAPPFKAVKMHYTRQYENKEDFVNAVVNWVQNPNEDDAFMYGAVMKFKVMPKLELEKKEIEKIASYLYDNDVEKPAWMNDCKKGNGKGNGNGKGKHGNGMGNGKGKGKGMKMYNN